MFPTRLDTHLPDVKDRDQFLLPQHEHDNYCENRCTMDILSEARDERMLNRVFTGLAFSPLIIGMILVTLSMTIFHDKNLVEIGFDMGLVTGFLLFLYLAVGGIPEYFNDKRIKTLRASNDNERAARDHGRQYPVDSHHKQFAARIVQDNDQMIVQLCSYQLMIAGEQYKVPNRDIAQADKLHMYEIRPLWQQMFAADQVEEASECLVELNVMAAQMEDEAYEAYHLYRADRQVRLETAEQAKLEAAASVQAIQQVGNASMVAA